MDSIRHLVRALSGSSRAVVSRTGLSGAQLFILRQLATADGPLSVNELAERTLTHQSTVSGVLHRLVERRLVTRSPAADDARRVAISLTARGRTLLADAPPTVQTQLVDGLAHLSPERRATLADTLEAWLAAAGLGSEPAPLFFEDTGTHAATRRRSPRSGTHD
jgi:DNA-binding MarR family transcriptional regulator